MSEHGIEQVFRLLWPDFGALSRGDLGGITAVIVILIWIISGWFLFFAARERHRAVHRVAQLHSILEDATTDELVALRPALRQRAEESDRNVRHLWREFDETLVVSQDQKSLWNTIDAEHFFNSQSLAPG